MRDPARIDAVLAEVRSQWEAAPDLRLGQLIYQAIQFAIPEGRMPPEMWLLAQIEEPMLMEGLRIRREGR